MGSGGRLGLVVDYVLSLGRPRPALRAWIMAVARSAEPSLVKMVDTLLATVFGARSRRVAIAGLERPAASRSRISRSRVVSSGNGSVGGGAAKKVRTRRA